MNLELSEDQRLLAESVHDFAANRVAPGAADRDREGSMPESLRTELAEMGFLGICIPEEYGGSGMDVVSSCIVVSEISQACAGTGVFLSAHNSLCVDPILTFGTPAQKEKYLPRLAGGTVGCLSLTEPGSGSDAGAATCTAVERDDGWHVTGSKIFVTNGQEAGIIILIAVTNPDDPKRRLSAFIVEQPSPGLRIAKLEKKLGIRCTSTAEYVFEDCVVPKENLLHERGRGLNVALSTLDGGRIGIGAQAVGIAQACLNESVQYARTREQFGRPIGKFQAIQNKIADMGVEIEVARQLMFRAAWLKDNSQPYESAAAKAKLYASEMCSRAANHAVQVFGGYGYCNDYPVERLLRDAKITELYEGTSEIQRLVIARHVAEALTDGWDRA